MFSLVGQPRVPQKPLSRDSLGLVDLKNLFEKVTDFRVSNLRWNRRELAALDFAK